MISFAQGLILLLLLVPSLPYEQINTKGQLQNYHQMNSQFPIIHLYHNHHFSTAPQFQDFLEVLEETEYRNKDYVRFVLTDCEQFKDGATYACDQMKRTKDNRMVFGYYPSEQFVNYGGKRMQNPPKNRQFNHPADVYTVQQFETFIGQIMPNFFAEITSVEQYEQWLKPLYSPKILFATREDEVPLVLRKLAVHFFLRFDMGFVSDLSENVIQKVEVSSFPTLMVLKYNFEKKVLDAFPYDGNEFSEQNYQQIKEFLQPHALQQPRNDLIFHMMKLQPDAGILVSDNSAELQEILDRSSGWVIVSVVQGEPSKLKQLRNRYGRFFTYLHFLTGNQTESLQLYDSQHKTMHEIPTGDIYFKTLNQDQFIQTLAVWLKKNFVLMGVREKYSHYCALSLNNFFRGLTHCLIVKEDEYEAVSKAMNMEFQEGFACYETNAKADQKIVGRGLKGTYEDIYLNVQYLTRMKSKEIVDDFVDRPIKPIEGRDKLAEICAFPTKKCALLFTNSNKADRTAYDYLKEIAINFINEYQFYEIDLKCNPQLTQDIQILRKNNGGLLVYHPRNKSYVALKAKLSKSTFQKFLQANLKDNKKLPFHQFSHQDLYVTNCQNHTQEKESVSEQRESL